MNKPTAIVLAAGTSSRMGKPNKLLLNYCGVPLIKHVLSTIISAGPGQIILVTGHQEQEVKAAVTGMDTDIVYNPSFETGMTGSIQAGVQRSSGSGFMICLGDMYAITAEQYRSMMDFFLVTIQQDERCICVPDYNGTKGNPITFSAFYRNEILSHPRPDGCKAIVQANPLHLYKLKMFSDQILKDLDTPEDYNNIRGNYC